MDHPVFYVGHGFPSPRLVPVLALRARDVQAHQARHSLGRELMLLALHGYLHLLGHDHETDDGSMVRLERGLARRLLPVASGEAS